MARLFPRELASSALSDAGVGAWSTVASNDQRDVQDNGYARFTSARLGARAVSRSGRNALRTLASTPFSPTTVALLATRTGFGMTQTGRGAVNPGARTL